MKRRSYTKQLRVQSKIHIDKGDACYIPRKGGAGVAAGLLFPKIKTKKKRKHHSPSILHDKDHTCYLCMLLDGNHKLHRQLHEHHIFGGPNRIHSEEYGLKVYLCPDHHLTGNLAVHNCKETMDLLHKIGQREFEKTHSREEFMEIFGKNYL